MSEPKKVEFSDGFKKAMESGPAPEVQRLVRKTALAEAKLIERVLRDLCGSRENAEEWDATGRLQMQRRLGSFDTHLVLDGECVGIFRREFVGASIVYKFEPVK